MIAAPAKWKVAVYLAAIFAAGAVSGWVVGGHGAKKTAQPAPVPPSGPVFWKQSSVFQIGLSAAQTNQAKEIIERYAKQMESTEGEHRKIIRVASSNRNEELKGILNEEQRQQWDKYRKDRDAARDAAWRNSRTNSGPGGSNGFKNWPSGPGPWDKGEGGGHSRSNRDRRGPDGRSVTSAPNARSTPPP